MSGHVGGGEVSARDALLVWARRMVAGYPGVRVTDFTQSWRDGLAFLAILHRYRSDHSTLFSSGQIVTFTTCCATHATGFIENSNIYRGYKLPGLYLTGGGVGEVEPPPPRENF